MERKLALMQRILVPGKTGQAGWELQGVLAPQWQNALDLFGDELGARN